MDKVKADRKRKNSHDDDKDLIIKKDVDADLDLDLNLGLAFSSRPRTRSPITPRPEQSPLQLDLSQFNPATNATFPIQPPPPPPPRRNLGPSKTDTIDPPFPWATDRRATVHSLRYLLSHNITVVEGQSQCRRCEARTVVPYEIIPKFEQVVGFILRRHQSMYDRAPPEWTIPQYPACGACGQANAVRPVIADKKREINWLFMFFGQTIGQCTLEQLRWFCKHTGNHRTGAKDRVLYLTYLTICKQLDPDCPFSKQVGSGVHRSQPRLLG